MDLIKQINQSPELGGLLRALLKEGAGKSDYRFNLTARRLKQLAIGGSLEQNDEWLARLEWLAQHGCFQFKPAADERLEGSWISLSAEQHARLDEQLQDQARAFLNQWPTILASAEVADQVRPWLLDNPPQPGWAAELNWSLALRRLDGLSADRQYSGQQLGAFLLGNAKVTERSPRAREWLTQLGRCFGWQLIDRGLLLHAHLPPDCHNILLIENQDTYLRLINAQGDWLGLVFVAGYRAASERLLERSQCYFGYTAESNADAVRQFEAYWFDGVAKHYDMRYWGDLDKDGLIILARMQALLPGLQPWMSAYRAMQSLQPGHSSPAPEADNLQRLLSGGDVHQEAVLNLNQLEWD